MRLIYVDKLPGRARKKNLQKLIEAFCESGREIARVDFNQLEYKNAQSCYSCMWIAAKNSKRPVKVCCRGDEVYLTKI